MDAYSAFEVESEWMARRSEMENDDEYEPPHMTLSHDGVWMTWCPVHRTWEWECLGEGCHIINDERDDSCKDCGRPRSGPGY